MPDLTIEEANDALLYHPKEGDEAHSAAFMEECNETVVLPET
jgi:hypothetical protein